MNEVKKNLDSNWQYIYDIVKKINTERKKYNTENEILKNNPDIEDFKKNNPKSYILAISGKFSLIEFKKQKEVYDRAYSSQHGDHFSRKNGANIAVANKVARDHGIYKGREPDFKKAVGAVMEKAKSIKVVKDEVVKDSKTIDIQE
jgi:hypothetical protein